MYVLCPCWRLFTCSVEVSDLHRLTLDVSLQRLYQFPFCLLFLLGHKVREAKQHAGKWLWQYIQWLWDGWFGVRASPRIMVCANWQREKSNKQCACTQYGEILAADMTSELPSAVWAGEGGWGAAAGWGRAAPSLSWTIWRWSRIPRCPAPRTSSAKPSRSPRTSRSCCGLLRRTNMTGQNLRSGSVFFSFHFLGSILNLQFLFFHHNSVIISCLYLLSFPLLLVIFTLPLHSTSTSIVSVSRCPRPSPVWADHVSVKACVGSGTAWDVSALWCPGLRRPPLPFSRSASGPLTPPPGTLASVPASQAQFYFPLPHLCPSVSPANNLALLVWCAAECVQFKKTVSELISCIYALTWFWHVGERSWCNTCIQADVNAV